MPLLVLAHVDADHVLLGVEQRRGQGPGQLGLARRRSGPRKMNEPIGRRGSLIPERARMMASATSWTASSWPIDPLVEDLVEAEQLLPLALLQPAHRDARSSGTRSSAISSSVTTSRSSRLPPCLAARRSSSACEPALELGQLAVAQLGGPVEVVGPLGLLGLVAHALDLLAQRLHLAAAPGARPPTAPAWRRPRPAGRPAPCAAPPGGRLLAGSFSLASAASSISRRMTRRVSSSSSAGIESISVRSMAQASSTRSMALSGRKRSEM